MTTRTRALQRPHARATQYIIPLFEGVTVPVLYILTQLRSTTMPVRPKKKTHCGRPVSTTYKRKRASSPAEDPAPKRVQKGSLRGGSGSSADGGTTSATSSQPIVGTVAHTGEADGSARRSSVEVIINDDADEPATAGAEDRGAESEDESSDAELGESLLSRRQCTAFNE
jgi:hypothetical protein